MDEKYFVIGANENGDPYIQDLSRETLEDALGPDGWIDPEKCMPDIPTDDPAHWRGRYVILKGDFVMPRATETVVKWRV